MTLRPDGGLTSTIAQLSTGGLPLTSLGLTLDSDFMTLPTSCAPATVTLNGESASFTPTGCAERAVHAVRGRRAGHAAARPCRAARP